MSTVADTAAATPPAQRFTVSLAEDARFAGEGLRPQFVYRDLGIAEATAGRYHAQVIRASEAIGKNGSGTGLHHHDLDFQMVYVLKGWVSFHYEGEGDFTFRPGDAVLQPPGIRHELRACSDDLEMLEITSPADFATHADA